jgi:hypothetical protein
MLPGDFTVANSSDAEDEGIAFDCSVEMREALA